MRKTGLVFLLTLVLCFTGSLTAFGRTEGHVFDEAGLYTQEEAADLTSRAEAIGETYGTDVNGTGLKRYQVENSKKLREKWADEFKRQSVNDGNPNPFRARERSQGKKVILVVDHYVPTFDKDAGSKTTYQYLKMFLKMGYVVKFLGDNFLHEEPYSTALQQMGI